LKRNNLFTKAKYWIFEELKKWKGGNKNSVDRLCEDFEKLKKLCSASGLFYDGRYGPKSCFVVRFSLETNFLEKYEAKIWGIIPKKKVVIQLKFDWDYIYGQSDDIPTIFVFQSSDNNLSKPILEDVETEFGIVQWFIETRLTTILRKNWFEKPKELNLLRRSSSNLPKRNNEQKKTEIDEKFLKEIMAMGFSKERSTIALEKNKK